MKATKHSLLSSYREALIEHLFVGEVLRELWKRGPVEAEIMKPQVDEAGYDVVIEARGITRHIQLKSSFIGARTARQKLHLKLGRKPSGCVVWVMFDQKTLDLGPLLWFGGKPGKPLPSLKSFKVAKHTKADSTGHKADRPMHRVIPKGSFERVESISEVVRRLFG